MLLSCLMLVGIKIVMLEVSEVLYWRILHSTQPQWLTIMEPLLAPVLVLSVIIAVGMKSIQQSLREYAKAMDYGLELPLYVVCPYINV